jgi:hypothetical protein
VTRLKTAGCVAAAALGALGLAAPAFAHHSFAAYDPNKQISFKGTVTSFAWHNPHVYIEMDQPTEGAAKHWLVECANPGILDRVGWKWNMIKAGDVITVIVAPMQNGQPGALLKSVKLPDGQVFGDGGPAGPAKIEFAE